MSFDEYVMMLGLAFVICAPIYFIMEYVNRIAGFSLAVLVMVMALITEGGTNV